MRSFADNTAVLIFASSSQAEVKRKMLPKNPELFEALNQKVVKTVQDTSLPFFHFTEQHQRGTSFGERFVNAVQSVFDKGYETLIVVGNDSPQLSKAHLERARRALASKSLVLGPSADGGFYLLGLTASSFHSDSYLNFSWQTSVLKDEILEHAKAIGYEVFQLNTLFDLDNLEDFRRFFHRFRSISRSLFQSIAKLFLEMWVALFPAPYFYTSPISIVNRNKGSPVFPFS